MCKINSDKLDYKLQMTSSLVYNFMSNQQANSLDIDVMNVSNPIFCLPPAHIQFFCPWLFHSCENCFTNSWACWQLGLIHQKLSYYASNTARAKCFVETLLDGQKKMDVETKNYWEEGIKIRVFAFSFSMNYLWSKREKRVQKIILDYYCFMEL